MKVCDVGEASQHSERLRGECKILTGVSENERTREMSATKYYNVSTVCSVGWFHMTQDGLWNEAFVIVVMKFWFP